MRLSPQPVFAAGTEHFAGGHCIVKNDIACVLVAGVSASDTQTRQLAEIAGIALPKAPGVSSCVGSVRSLWLTPQSSLVLCTLDEEKELVARINLAFPEKRIHATSYTDFLCWFELSGPGDLHVLTQGGFVSLEPEGVPVGHAKRTLLAGVAAVILRDQVAKWLIGIERSRSRYFADWMRAAAMRAAESKVRERHPFTQTRRATVESHSSSK